MDSIDKIKAKLKKYPHIKYELWDGGITVFPESEDGFPIDFWQKDVFYVEFISTAVWQREFDDEEEALNCFVLASSNEVRIKEVRCSDVVCKLIVQFRDDKNWVDETVNHNFFYPFWKKKSTRYLQNDLVK